MYYNENGLMFMIIAIQLVIMDYFSSLPWLLIHLGFSLPFHLHAKTNFNKKEV